MYILAVLTLVSHTPLAAPDTSFRVAAGASVDITARTQPVIITGTTGDVITVHGASVEVDGKHIDIEGALLASGIDAPIIVRIPTSVRLEIDAVLGAVTITNAPDRVEVHAVNGAVRVTGGRGEMEISAMGAVTVTGFAGTRLSVNGLSGAVTIQGATGEISVESVSGPVFLEGIASRSVTVQAVNGLIRWRGAFDPKGHFEFESHNGGVEFIVPASFDARLEVETFNGGLSSALPAQKSGDAAGGGIFGERNITAIYGKGRATIEVSTFNGGVHVRKLDGE